MRPCELAERSGISKSVISRYLSGKYVPKYAAACKMARVLDVDARYLMAESSLGERIRLLRIERGISADALGAQIGKDRATVYRYEAGMSCPAETLSLLASALRTTPEYLMGWTDEVSPPSSGSSTIERYVSAYAAADPVYQQVALELLESHPKKSSEEIK